MKTKEPVIRQHKPYAIAADGKVCSNSKSLCRNYLQCLCQVKPSIEPSTAIQTSIVDAMRVVRMRFQCDFNLKC